MVPNSRLGGRTLARASIAIAIAGPGSLGTALASAAATAPSGGTAAPAAADNTHLKVTVTPRQHILRGDDDPVHGSVRPGRRGRSVLIQVRHDGHGWETVAHARTGADGRFRTSWATHSLGNYAADDPESMAEVRRDADFASNSGGAEDIAVIQDIQRTRLLRQPDCLRRDAQAQHAGRRPQDAAMRHQGRALLSRSRGHGPGDRPRPVRRRSRVRPDGRDQGPSALRLDRDRLVGPARALEPLERQFELPRGGSARRARRRLLVEPRHAYAEQPHRPGRVELA